MGRVARHLDPQGLFTKHPVDVAPLLLGATLTSRLSDARVVLRITEVEAYGGLGEDPGSHAFRRMTPRNSTMFGPPARAYVYFTYGMHWCLNVVAGPEGQAGAVLIRAGEIVEGVPVARVRRGSRVADRDLARGPARLASALGVTGEQDGTHLLAPRSLLHLSLPAGRSVDVEASPRTGVAGEGAHTPWRFYLPGEPTVSPYRPATRRSRGG